MTTLRLNFGEFKIIIVSNVTKNTNFCEFTFLNIRFQVNYPNRGADSIKEKLKNILDTAKTQTKSGVVKIPIIFGDNGAVEYYETLTSIKEEIKNFKARLLTIENLQQCILNSTTINESKGMCNINIYITPNRGVNNFFY